ncbi:MAG: alanine/glycine:cation symporter family protein [Bacteroidia bacterium]
MRKLYALFIFLTAFNCLAAQEDQPEPEKTLDDRINENFQPVVEVLEKVFFWDPFEAIGLYDPVVYKDDGAPFLNERIEGFATVQAGSDTVYGANSDFNDLEPGMQIVLGDKLVRIKKVLSSQQIVLQKPSEKDHNQVTYGLPLRNSIPIVVVWLAFGALFFTLYLGFINIRAFRHAIDLVRGVFDNPKDAGEVSHFQALTTALSATVGLGNIAGVAVAISLGGPGATFWMIVLGLLGMSSKFVECTLGLKYRTINAKGEVSGGPMYYLSTALKKKKMGGLGKVLAVMFAILCVLASFGGGNMFQANQSFAQLSGQFPIFAGNGAYYGLVLAILVAVVIIGGIKSIARVTDKVVPFMGILYVTCALIIIGLHITEIGSVFMLIFDGAFDPGAMKGGVIGVLIVGFQRAAFSNEAGVGSASIAHSAAKTPEPVSEGIVALLEPFVDTVVICTMTALVILFTGRHGGGYTMEGAELTSNAFGSIITWFPEVLVLIIFLFAFSTMISWSYYGLKAWTYLLGGSKWADLSYKILFLGFIVLGASSGLGAVIDFSDMMILAMAFPNILGLLILAPEVKKDLQSYLSRVKSGAIKRYK